MKIRRRRGPGRPPGGFAAFRLALVRGSPIIVFVICPACQRPLIELEVGGVVLDVCHGGCGGIWVDEGELEKIDGTGDFTLNVPIDASSAVDHAQPRTCPRCDGKSQMRQVEVGSGEGGATIDTCPACGGTWLDHGELERIKDL